MQLHSNLGLSRVLRTTIHRLKLPLPVLVNKVVLEHSDTLCLHTFYGLCMATKTELSRCDRGRGPHGSTELKIFTNGPREKNQTSCLSNARVHWMWNPQSCHFGEHLNYKKTKEKCGSVMERALDWEPGSQDSSLNSVKKQP